jgi:hypothetical protein
MHEQNSANRTGNNCDDLPMKNERNYTMRIVTGLCALAHEFAKPRDSFAFICIYTLSRVTRQLR